MRRARGAGDDGTVTGDPVYAHARAAAEVATALGSDLAVGLEVEDAARRLAASGPNELPRPTHPGPRGWRCAR